MKDEEYASEEVGEDVEGEKDEEYALFDGLGERVGSSSFWSRQRSR